MNYKDLEQQITSCEASSRTEWPRNLPYQNIFCLSAAKQGKWYSSMTWQRYKEYLKYTLFNRFFLTKLQFDTKPLSVTQVSNVLFSPRIPPAQKFMHDIKVSSSGMNTHLLFSFLRFLHQKYDICSCIVSANIVNTHSYFAVKVCKKQCGNSL